jgi:hypothetical protein
LLVALVGIAPARAAEAPPPPPFQLSVQGGVAVGSLGDLGRVDPASDAPPSRVGPHLRAGFEHPLAALGPRARLRGELCASWLQFAGGRFGSPRNPLAIVEDGAGLLDLGWMVRVEVVVARWLLIAPGLGVGFGGWRYATELVNDAATSASAILPTFVVHADLALRFALTSRHLLFLAPGLVFMLPPLVDGGPNMATTGNIGVYDITTPPRGAFAVGSGKWNGTFDLGYAIRF